LTSSQGKVWGGLRVEVPAPGAWEVLSGTGWVLALYLILVTGVLVLFGSVMISRNVVRPIRKLMAASERIAGGDYDVSWEGYPSHEVGRLAEALQAMSRSLQEKQQALEKQVEDLGAANRALIQAQQALLRSEKLASVGRLSAGVAHEIGNPVASILGYLEILLQDLQGKEQRDCLVRVRAEAERVQRIVRSLLELGRPSGRRWGWVDVERAVDEALAFLRGHPEMRGIEVRWAPGGKPHSVWADGDQIQQLLFNLVLNALDALGGRGEISIRVGAVSRLPEEDELVPPPRRRGEPQEIDFTPLRRTGPSLPAIPAGPFVFIQVEDTGEGIAQEDLPHLFEPFFTTKPAGRGTGLGLAVCMGIVESYGGRIRVETQAGEGSRFTVYLPVGDSGAVRSSSK
jgi:signal transduction histidine kinase